MSKQAEGRLIVKGVQYAPKPHGEDQGKVTLLFSWKDEELRSAMVRIAGKTVDAFFQEHEEQRELDGIEEGDPDQDELEGVEVGA